jgi:hypothetical protein
MPKPHVAYVIEPRFPGGTSSAVAAEIEVVSKFARVTVHGLSTSMFSGRDVSPNLHATLDRLGLEVMWDSPTISGDVVLFHNPSCLKFQDKIATKIITSHLIVIAHENFLRPSGAEAFDVAHCMAQISACSVALRKSLAPISDWNRETISQWHAKGGRLDNWSILDVDWFNICAFDILDPQPQISDRRGRLSRPGYEKFPTNDVMETCFPATAECNVILGANPLMADPMVPAHWTLYPFRGLPVDRFFEMIDFMIYFTAPTFRESFGRVMAEGIAAGKIVISDPDTARIFKGAVIAAQPDQVDGIIQSYLKSPATYAKDVRSAQAVLSQFSPDAFARQLGPILTAPEKAIA